MSKTVPFSPRQRPPFFPPTGFPAKLERVLSLLRAAHLALTFMTTLPLPHVGEVREGEFSKASGFYPLAGYAVGGVLALVWWICSSLNLPAGVSAALILSAWLWITGMLHFDGLVDSADAIFAMKSPARRLEILSDVHIGAFGLATGIIVLLLKWSLLESVSSVIPLILAPVMARVVLLAPMNFFRAARAESLGARSREGWWPVAVLLSSPLLLVSGGWVVALAALVWSMLVAKFCANRLGGGISGDVYGAIVETAEIVGLLAWTVWMAAP